MNAKILVSGLSITSNEISQMVESRHDKVKQSIERLAQRGVISLPPMGEKATAGRPVTFYIFSGDQGKRDSIIVVAQLSPEFTARLVDRWQQLEIKVRDIEATKKIRDDARLEYRPMTDAIKSERELAGKDIKPHHFSNEADLINRIALGMTAAKFRAHHELKKDASLRDYLTPEQIRCVVSLQRANTVYIEAGMAFEDRKVKLRELYDRNHHAKLIAEVHLLEA